MIEEDIRLHCISLNILADEKSLLGFMLKDFSVETIFSEMNFLCS